MNGCVIATYRCNARCQMCEIWKSPTRKEEEITPDILAKLPNNLGRVNLTGGEPILRDDIKELTKILYKKAGLVEIRKNGYFTEEELLKRNKGYRFLLRGLKIES